MDKNDDFLRDFFKDQNLFQKKEEFVEPLKEEEDKVESEENKTSSTSSNTPKVSRARDINLKALFEGISEEQQNAEKQVHKSIVEMELRKRYQKSFSVIQKKLREKLDRVIEHPSFFIQQEKIIREKSQAKKIPQPLFQQKIGKKEQTKVEMPSAFSTRTIGNRQKEVIENFTIQSLSPFCIGREELKKRKTAEKNRIDAEREKDIREKRAKKEEQRMRDLKLKREEKEVRLAQQVKEFERKRKQKEKFEAEQRNLREKARVRAQENFDAAQRKREEIEKEAEKKQKEENQKRERDNKKAIEPIFRVSRKGQPYLSALWETSPERIPVFEKTSSKKELKPRKKGKKENIPILKSITEKIPDILSVYNEYRELAQRGSGYFAQKIEQGTSHAKRIHSAKLEEFSLWNEERIENKKKNQEIKQRKQEELRIQEQKKQEEADRKEREREIAANKAAKDSKIKLQKQQEKNRVEREKQEKAELKKAAELFEKSQKNTKHSFFSTQKSAFPKHWEKHKSKIKEWSQIAGMVTGVFIVGVVGLRLPGIMSQYESVWNADFFDTQQESVSFLLEEKENPFENVKSLPVAGDLRTNEESIENNQFLTITPPDTRIIIPKIAKNIPILQVEDNSRRSEDWEQLEADIQDALQDGVVHYPGTALPGDDGNVFITGHSSYYPWDPGRYKDVFAALHNLEVGDEYYIFHKGKKFKYVITSRSVVPPSDVSVLDQDRNKKESTLMTCTPVGTAKNRLILKAEQVAVEY